MSLPLAGLGHLYAGASFATAGRMYLLTSASGAIAIALLVWFPIGLASLPLALLVLFGALAWVARDAARRAMKTTTPRRPWDRWEVYLALFIAASLLERIPYNLVRLLVIEAFHIPSEGMIPTLVPGDFVFVIKGSVQVRRGVVVVYAAVDADTLAVVKRAVGLPGDTLSMRHDTLYRNGAAVSEPYLQRGAGADIEDSVMRRSQAQHFVGNNVAAYRPTLKNWGPLLVPHDSIFVLGDNRDESYDSRYFGFVGRDRIRGRPYRIYYSYDASGIAPLPFITAVRWERIGRRFEP